MYGLIELFVSDYTTGGIWHAAQFRRPFRPPGPFLRPGFAIVWSPWTQIAPPLPPPPASGIFFITGFSLSANADGRLELFAMGFDGNPYHMYQLPVPPYAASLTGELSWSSWSPMTTGPNPLTSTQPQGLPQFNFTYWPQSANLLGSIVVCYYDWAHNPNVIYYDYQIPDHAQVGGMGWASVSNKEPFAIPIPGLVSQNPNEVLPYSISLCPSAEGLSLLLLIRTNGVIFDFLYVSSLTTPSGAWSAWQLVPPTPALPVFYPNRGLPDYVSSSVSYLPPGGAAALFFCDNVGSLTVLRQLIPIAPGQPPGPVWNQQYEVQLPPGSIRAELGVVGVTNDVSASATDRLFSYQAAFFPSPDGLELQTLEFRTSVITPGPRSGVTYWPAVYPPTAPGAPTTIDTGAGGAFTALDQIVAITPPDGKIRVFGFTDGTATVYGWTQP
jgi:hypothetical protein